VPSQGGYATVGATSGAGNTWSNPTNVQGAPDGSYAASTGSGNTRALTATGYGFAIPVGATIVGIALSVTKLGDGTVIRDLTVELLNGGTPAGSNYADTATDWPLPAGATSYGGPADLWGAAWTPADINLGSFGAYLAATSVSPDTGPQVDSMGITVYYTDPAVNEPTGKPRVFATPVHPAQIYE
jgi:hypothetical protein